jgi:ribulose-5-phosphate 4-epimerase/fuculose-1-phosphate aldolase
MTLPEADPALVEKLAMANRILFDQGVVDGFGHISVRHDKSPDHFLLSCNRAPGLVRPEDILNYDMNGDLAVPSDKRSYLERFIHSEIYRVRPDVVSVVHSHSPSVIPFGVTGQRLRPVFHMSGFWAVVRRCSRFEIPAAIPTC